MLLICHSNFKFNHCYYYHHYHHHHHHLHCHRSFWKFFVISLNDDVIHHVCNMIRQDSKSEKYFLNGRFIFSVGGNWKINSKWSKLVIKLKVNCFSGNTFIIHKLKDYLLVIEFNGFSWYQFRRTEINKLAVTSILNSLNLFKLKDHLILFI